MQPVSPAINTSRARTTIDVGTNPSAEISARLDRLPLTRHLWMLIFLISLGAFFEVYDLIFTAYIAPGLAKSGLLSSHTHEFFGANGIAGFIAATFAGLLVGTFGFGWLPDRYGRRVVFTISLLWYSISSAIMALQSSGESIIFWRFITGIGIGVEIITIDSYVTELVPQYARGKAIAFNQFVAFVAAPVAALLSYWFIPEQIFGLDGWRIVVLSGSVGAALIWFVRRSVPESPRWLATHGRLEEAQKVLRKIEETSEQQYGRPLPQPSPVVEQPSHRRASFGELLSPPYRSRLIMLSVFNFCQAIGYYGFANWVPTLLIGQGVTITKSLLYSFVIAFALPVGPMLAMAYADRIQRKYIIVVAALVVVVCGIAFGQSTTMGPLIFFGVLISLAGQTISVCYHAYQAELFPTAVRCQANGIVYSASRFGAMFSGFFIAFLLKEFGVPGVFVGITACMIAVAITIGIYGPKTNGKKLEELNH